MAIFIIIVVVAGFFFFASGPEHPYHNGHPNTYYPAQPIVIVQNTPHPYDHNQSPIGGIILLLFMAALAYYFFGTPPEQPQGGGTQHSSSEQVIGYTTAKTTHPSLGKGKLKQPGNLSGNEQ